MWIRDGSLDLCLGTGKGAQNIVVLGGIWKRKFGAKESMLGAGNTNFEECTTVLLEFIRLFKRFKAYGSQQEGALVLASSGQTAMVF